MTGRKHVTKETGSPTKEPEKGEDSTPTDTGEGYVPAVSKSCKLIMNFFLTVGDYFWFMHTDLNET